MDNKSIKIGIVGAGAVGGVISAILAENGYDVELAKRYASDIVIDDMVGLEITGQFGNKTVLVPSVNGIESFTSKKDVIFILTKAYEAVEVAKIAMQFLKPQGIIVSSQNVMNIEPMLNAVGVNKLFALIINWSAVRHHKAKMEVLRSGDMQIGNFTDESNYYLGPLQTILSCVAPTKISDNILGLIWSRTIINCCINSVGAICGQRLGNMLLLPYSKKIFKNIIFESMNLAKKLNVNVEPYGMLNYYKFVDKRIGSVWYRFRILRLLRIKNAYTVSSSLRYIENKQKTEVDYLNGYIYKKSAEQGLKAPLNERIYDMIKEIENGERQILIENMMDYYLRHPKKYHKKIVKNDVTI